MSVRRDPFETMERMFEQMRQAGFRDAAFTALDGADAFDANVSLDRDDDAFVVVADLPGFEREEIDATYADGTLTISGTHEHGDGESYRSHSVQESVAIPEDVDQGRIGATYRNGVLEVRLPIEETDAESYRIDIE